MVLVKTPGPRLLADAGLIVPCPVVVPVMVMLVIDATAGPVETILM
jgi:hypothetical protein